MEMANITINGQPVSAPVGSTILQAARGAGIDIPTLCDHPALTSVGACRVCVVEVQGQRTLITACTFPISEGMVIQTESEQVIKARKLVLDLLFSERNHFCPFCEASGNCELQNLGYRYGVDHWNFPTFTKRFPIDASHKYLFMEHNRCVLCGRCERACGDVVANHTLGLKSRGNQSMIHCDASLPWSESTCISCGTCFQVCPTGAISDKRSAYMGREETQTESTKSTCSQCSVGCGIEILTRSGNVLRIKGDWDAPVSGGRLCEYGRFSPLFDQRVRITSPLLRRNGKLDPVSWEAALEAVSGYLGKVSPAEIGMLTSSHATNEALYLASQLFSKQLKASNVGMLNPVAPKRFSQREGSLDDVVNADVIVVVGADPVREQPVSSFFIKHSVDKGARLIVVDDKDNGLAPFAYAKLGMAEIGKAVGLAERAMNPVVLYGAGVSEAAAQALGKLEKARFIPLELGVNTRAAEALGFNNGFKPSSVKVLYALLGEEDVSNAEALKQIGDGVIVVAQASFASPLTERADVVLPAAVWSERGGSLTNTEGRLQKVKPALKPKGEAKPDWEILSLLAQKLGGKSGASLDEISTLANQEIGHKENQL